MIDKEWKPEPEIKVPVLWMVIATAVMFTLGFYNSCVTASEPRYAQSVEDIHAATCKVIVRLAGGMIQSGTGTVNLCKDGTYTITTNYHVVEKNKNVELEFYGNSKPFTVQGTVTKRAYDTRAPYDYAVVECSDDKLKAYNPPVLPFAPKGADYDKDIIIVTAGCPSGHAASVQKGHITGTYGKTILYQPPPEEGRSGSALVQYNKNGMPECIGHTAWRVGNNPNWDDNNGGAIPIANFYEAMSGRRPTGDSNSVPPEAVPVVGRFMSRNVLNGNGFGGNCLGNSCFGGSCLGGNCFFNGNSSGGNCFGDSCPLFNDSFQQDKSTTNNQLQLPNVSYNNKEFDGYLMVLEKDDCLPCEAAHIETERLQKLNFPIYVRNVSQSKAWERFRVNNGINKLPAFIMVGKRNGKDCCLKKWFGRKNVTSNILTAFNEIEVADVKPCQKAELPNIPYVPEIDEYTELGPAPKEETKQETAPKPCEKTVLPPIPDVISKIKIPEDFFVETEVVFNENVGKEFRFVPAIYYIDQENKRETITFDNEPVYEVSSDENDPLVEEYQSAGLFGRDKKKEPDKEQEEPRKPQEITGLRDTIESQISSAIEKKILPNVTEAVNQLIKDQLSQAKQEIEAFYIKTCFIIAFLTACFLIAIVIFWKYLIVPLFNMLVSKQHEINELRKMLEEKNHGDQK